jgi:hypothetical protein
MFPLLFSIFQFLAAAVLAAEERVMSSLFFSCQNIYNFLPVLLIRLGFSADPDPAFYLKCGSRSGSREPNPVRIQIRILVRL